jgi:hypothetical protein
MAASSDPATIPEPELNRLLREVDWRFLLRNPEPPRLAPLGSEPTAALKLIAGEAAAAGEATLAVLGFPRRRQLAAARAALGPGGEVVCLWRRPRLGGQRRARARLRRAGFGEVRTHWAGPGRRSAVQFWLPLDSAAAKAHLLASRPPRGAAQRLLRPLWRLADRLGLLAPACAIGSLAGGAEADEIDALLPRQAPALLLTGGHRSINKVVALPFPPGNAGTPSLAVKFARVEAADQALDREEEALRAIERDHPGVRGVPAILARGRRSGRRALAESAVHGNPLLATLTPSSFGEISQLVASWLPGLVGASPRPPAEWRSRLVEEPLATFEANFGAVLSPGAGEQLRASLNGLEALPPACEHRDCSPWNVVLGSDGAPGLLDWESAEPRGLPGLDLAYFLANCVFVLDGALDSGRTRESYQRLLAGDSPHSATTAAREAEYGERTGLGADALQRLRLLAWLIHSRSDHRHLTMAAAGPPSPEALRGAPYLGLVEVELETARSRPASPSR